MRLRVSGEHTGKDYKIDAVMRGEGAENDIPNGNLLNEFTEAIFTLDKERITRARERLIIEMGEQALIDSSATIAAFNAYPRMADATGIPLEDAKERASAELRKNLGLDILKTL